MWQGGDRRCDRKHCHKARRALLALLSMAMSTGPAIATADELSRTSNTAYSQPSTTDRPMTPSRPLIAPAPSPVPKAPLAPKKPTAPAPTRPSDVPSPPQAPMPPPRQRAFPEPTPEDAARVVAPEDFNSNNLNSPIGIAAGPTSASPLMIGDFFGTAAQSTVVMLTPRSVSNYAIFGPGFNTGQGPVPPQRFGIGNTGQFPVPFFNSQSGPGQVIAPGVSIPLATNQPNINPDLSVPNPPGSSPLTIINGRATITSVTPPPGVLPPSAGPFGFADVTYFEQNGFDIAVPNPGGGGSVGSQKIAEGTSPEPRDRVYFFYDLFENVPLADGGVNVNRIAPGFEKTFFDRLMSIDIRIPMALTLDSNITTGSTQLSNGEFGNLTLNYKALLLRDNDMVYSAGLGISVPTADDVSVFLPNGSQIVTIQNKAVHLQPFFGALWTPSGPWFSQAFLQVDVDTNGNPVAINSTGASVTPAGRLQSPTFLFLSGGIGRWLVRNNDGWLTGVAVLSELHYNRTLQAADNVVQGPFLVGGQIQAIQLTNLTLGTTLQINRQSYLTAAYVTPLGGGSDQQFDGQFRLLFSRRFGPSAPAAFQ